LFCASARINKKKKEWNRWRKGKKVRNKKKVRSSNTRRKTTSSDALQFQ